jgi:hypothetical protein
MSAILTANNKRAAKLHDKRCLNNALNLAESRLASFKLA